MNKYIKNLRDNKSRFFALAEKALEDFRMELADVYYTDLEIEYTVCLKPERDNWASVITLILEHNDDINNDEEFIDFIKESVLYEIKNYNPEEKFEEIFRYESAHYIKAKGYEIALEIQRVYDIYQDVLNSYNKTYIDLLEDSDVRGLIKEILDEWELVLVKISDVDLSELSFEMELTTKPLKDKAPVYIDGLDLKGHDFVKNIKNRDQLKEFLQELFLSEILLWDAKSKIDEFKVSNPYCRKDEIIRLSIDLINAKNLYKKIWNEYNLKKDNWRKCNDK